MIKLSTGLIMLTLFIGHHGYGQLAVAGKVTDAEGGSVLPGVSVLIQGSSTGTVTDADGNYSLSVPEDAVIVFSYLGYASKEVPVSGRSVIDIALTSDIRQL